MTKIDWKRKLSSRKLWAALAGIVTGLAMVFGLDEGTMSNVAGAVVSVASVVAYIITRERWTRRPPERPWTTSRRLRGR